jgi:M3 family oligoendopeptidase
MGTFFRMLREHELMDLKGRPGKAGGGYCTMFPEWGAPFIYANFNGTKGDVVVFTHEMGHAFQGWSSRNKPVQDQVWPTMESAEIHSMSLEFLTWPWMEQFFGADASRFRQQHLAETLLFIPYGVAVDHFQHLVYARPEASADERNAMWQEVERLYLPWRTYGGIPALARGAFWQKQGHIYGMPFYYIDYTLAATCALQFWVRASTDPKKALDDYITLCRRGGEAPFRDLCQGAGLRAPFDDGALLDIVSRAAAELKVSVPSNAAP